MAEQISTSREIIRSQMIELSKEYLELQDIDFNKTHYLSYILNILSALTSNLMYFSSTSHHESNLLTARLDESIRNLSAFIGYNPIAAINAKVDVLISIDLSDVENLTEFKITLNDGWQLQSPNNIFKLLNKNISIEKFSGSLFRITLQTSYGQALLPYQYDTLTKTLSFYTSFDQVETVSYEYVVDDSIRPYQFYSIEQPIENYLTGTDLYVNGELWETAETTHTLSSTDKKYILKFYTDKFVIIFGNGFLGKQPQAGDVIQVIAYTTNGSNGNIIPGSIQNRDKMLLERTSGPDLEVKYTVYNSESGYNGTNLQTNNEIKSAAITSLKSLKRLVSSSDYKELKDITSIPFVQSISYLKRSDIKTNEVNTYGVLTYNDEIVPTTSFYLDVVRTNEPPTITNVNHTGITDDITISYDISDADYDMCNIRCYYSTNGGLDWNLTNHFTGLSSSIPTPSTQVLTWHSDQDVHGHFMNVVFKIIPNDNYLDGIIGYTGFMEIFNNNLPTLTNVVRTGTSGDIQFNFDLFDADLEYCNIRLEYSLDGGSTWDNSEHLLGEEHLDNNNHTIIWQSRDDDIRAGSIDIKVIPVDPWEDGIPYTETFFIQNNYKPVVSNVRV